MSRQGKNLRGTRRAAILTGVLGLMLAGGVAGPASAVIIRPVMRPIIKAVAKPVVKVPVVVGGVEAVEPVVELPAQAFNPLPVAVAAGQADTGGQLAAGGLAGLAAFIAMGSGFVLRRRLPI